MEEWEYHYIIPHDRNIARRDLSLYGTAAYGTAYDAASEATLNYLGSNGWELVEVRPENDMHVLRRAKRRDGTMQQWEYLCPVISVADPSNHSDLVEDELSPEAQNPYDMALQAVLNRFGTAGWELVGIRHMYNTWVMKRPKGGSHAPVS